jgi:uncharacterized alpha-E superfamily protein
VLSRTAENLYWMGRYMERAECTARLIEMGQRMAMLPASWSDEEWRSVLTATGCLDRVDGDAPVTEGAVLRTLMLDPENPASIRACLDRARANGRAERQRLTREMWEPLNENWRRLEGMDVATAERELPPLLDWVKNRAALFRGAASTSMLRADAYEFLRLGTHVERADMTLRLLDVKYYVLLPETDAVGGGRDYHQWTSVLWAASAMRAFHHVYRGDYSPWKIADFLILNAQFPRSVAFCYNRIGVALDRLGSAHGARCDCHHTAQAMQARLMDSEMGELFQEDLHAFILDAIAVTNRLSRELHRAYHF